LEKASQQKNAGGGKGAMAERKGAGMADAMAVAQAKRAEVAAKRAAKDAAGK